MFVLWRQSTHAADLSRTFIHLAAHCVLCKGNMTKSSNVSVKRSSCSTKQIIWVLILENTSLLSSLSHDSVRKYTKEHGCPCYCVFNSIHLHLSCQISAWYFIGLNFFPALLLLEGGQVMEEFMDQHLVGRSAIPGKGILLCLMKYWLEQLCHNSLNASLAYLVAPKDRLVSIDFHHKYFQTNLLFIYQGRHLTISL